MSVINRTCKVLHPVRTIPCCWSNYTTCERQINFKYGSKTTVKPIFPQIWITLQTSILNLQEYTINNDGEKMNLSEHGTVDKLEDKAKAASFRDLLPQDAQVQDHYIRDYIATSSSTVVKELKEEFPEVKLSFLRKHSNLCDFEPIMECYLGDIFTRHLPMQTSLCVSSAVLSTFISLKFCSSLNMCVISTQLAALFANVMVYRTFLSTICSQVHKNEKTQTYKAVFPFRLFQREVVFKNTHVKLLKNRFHWSSIRIKGRPTYCPKNAFIHVEEYEEMIQRRQLKTSEKNNLRTMHLKP